MQTLDLSTCAWTMRALGEDAGVPDAVRGKVFPARVPGCVHTDLMRAGAIGDPRIGFNERDQQWIGESDWSYKCVFEMSPETQARERIDLVCQGLDTIADVRINGIEVGRAANMFTPHRFDLRPALRPGANELEIIFRSPLKHIRAEEARLGKRPVNGDWDPYIFIRKAACNFGWDWAPKVATCGIWKPIRIEAWSGVRMRGVRTLVQRISGTRWRVETRVDLEWSGTRSVPEGLNLGAHLRDDERVDEWDSCVPALGAQQATLAIELEKPQLWWPEGLGDQPLYSFNVNIYAQGKSWGVSHSWHSRIGFREIRLNTDADEHGNKFQLEVNGQPVFCKGANWIPEGLFPDDRDPDKIRERIRQAAAANMNMLRVWGGGFYESDEFYSECDKLGIMVWQDFMFACACYPEEEPLRSLIETEARHQIARLSAHPSVVLWCGGNECIWGYESWGNAATDTEGPWKKRVGSRTWGRGYYFDLLPHLIRELDPTRPYWPNSPFSGTEGENPNQESRGDRHTWDASPGSRGFREIVPRFCAEFGHQAPANIETLRAVMGPSDFAVGSAALQHRQRATGGMERHIDEPMRAALAHHPDLAARHDAGTFEGWHALAQMTQAGSLSAAIEHLAANRPRCMGMLIWQFNDAWPSLSWSLIDSEGRPKPAYYAVQKAFRSTGPRV